MFDKTDREIFEECLGEPATLPDGNTILVIPDEHNEDFTTAGPDGEAVRVHPTVLLTMEDAEKYAIVDGEEGTVIEYLGRSARIIAMIKTTDGFYQAELGEV